MRMYRRAAVGDQGGFARAAGAPLSLLKKTAHPLTSLLLYGLCSPDHARVLARLSVSEESSTAPARWPRRTSPRGGGVPPARPAGEGYAFGGDRAPTLVCW